MSEGSGGVSAPQSLGEGMYLPESWDLGAEEEPDWLGHWLQQQGLARSPHSSSTQVGTSTEEKATNVPQDGGEASAGGSSGGSRQGSMQGKSSPSQPPVPLSHQVNCCRA